MKQLDTGWTDPAEVRGTPVRVFVSHGHSGHWDPVTLMWRAVVPDI